MIQDDETTRIRSLNDQLRCKRRGGSIILTAGVKALGVEATHSILDAMACFDEFSNENDPRREHDFGSLDYEDKKVFWKIDYYDPSMTKGSENPADPNQTCRVLTIMLAEEY